MTFNTGTNIDENMVHVVAIDPLLLTAQVLTAHPFLPMLIFHHDFLIIDTVTKHKTVDLETTIGFKRRDSRRFSCFSLFMPLFDTSSDAL
jgi:hypothetical protein